MGLRVYVDLLCGSRSSTSSILKMMQYLISSVKFYVLAQFGWQQHGINNLKLLWSLPDLSNSEMTPSRSYGHPVIMLWPNLPK
jgi:hypothetical protein